MKIKIFCVMILFGFLGTGILFASTASDVKKGNLLYNNKKYDEAIKIYDSVLEEMRKRPPLKISKATLDKARGKS